MRPIFLDRRPPILAWIAIVLCAVAALLMIWYGVGTLLLARTTATQVAAIVKSLDGTHCSEYHGKDATKLVLVCVREVKQERM